MEAARHAPFRRTDVYGEIGTDALPFALRVRLWLAFCLLVPLKALGCLLCLLVMWAAARLTPRTERGVAWPVPFTARAMARAGLLLIGFFRVRYRQIESDAAGGGVKRAGPAGARGSRAAVGTRAWRDACPIIVCNHTSWLDILVVQSLFAAAYLTRLETSRTPLVGDVCDALGCIYVSREHTKAAAGQATAPAQTAERSQCDEAEADVAGDAGEPADGGGAGRRLNGAAEQPQGQTTTAKMVAHARQKAHDAACRLRPLCVFPEGTTTNGRYLLPFKSGAFVAGVPVQPLLIAYDDRPGNPGLAWETVSATRHIALVLASLSHSATVYELPTYVPSEAERADPRLFAANVRQFLLDYAKLLGWDMQSSCSTFEDKVAYHKHLREKHGLASR